MTLYLTPDRRFNYYCHDCADLLCSHLLNFNITSLTKFNKAMCKDLHLGQGNAKHGYKLDRERPESSSEKKDLRLLVDETPTQHEQKMCICSLEDQQDREKERSIS